jgi:hypothetical protein
MNIIAKASQGYLLKYLIIGIAALAYGAWNLHDAFLVYPNEREKADAYEFLRGPLDEDGKSALPDGELQSRWQALAAENQWPENFPKLNSELDFLTLSNYFIGGIFSTIGVCCLFVAATTVGKNVKLEKDILIDPKGKSIDINSITKIDKKRWEKKGLVKLTGANRDGQSTTLLLDDIKFDRQLIDQILAHVEKTVGEDKIVNGQTEAYYEQVRLEKQAEKEAKQAALNQMEDDA